MVRPHMMPIIIAGPTASGKSALALRLALKYNGEIICADSRQFYSRMAIGAACPTQQEMALVAHHGYQTLDPKTDKLDAGYFVNYAQKAIAEIQKRGKRPILVGGGGLYFRALRYGLSDVPKSDEKILAMLEERCGQIGLEKMYAELIAIDPACQHKIKPQDHYRIVRALEIYHITKRPPSTLRHSFKTAEPQLKAHWVLKRPGRNELNQRIEERVVAMFDSGLVEEARQLKNALPAGHWCLDVMGYREALHYLDGQLSKLDAINRVIIRHKQYAKRQYTWFNSESFYRFVVSYT